MIYFLQHPKHDGVTEFTPPEKHRFTKRPQGGWLPQLSLVLVTVASAFLMTLVL